MSELDQFLAMLRRANIYHELQPVPLYTSEYARATRIVRVIAGPEGLETDRVRENNGYGGVSAYWHFDAEGVLLATGAF